MKKKHKGSNAQIGDKPFNDQKIIRCYEEEKIEWDKYAKLTGEKSTSAWLRRIANEAVRKGKQTDR